MNAMYVAAEQPRVLEQRLQELLQREDVKSILFFMAAESAYSPQLLRPMLAAAEKTIIGGLFPEIIVAGERYQRGVLLIPLNSNLDYLRVDMDQQEQFSGLLHEHFDALNDLSGTLMVFCDAFGNNKPRLTESLFNYFGISVTYLGGGAGSLTFQSSPCVLDNERLHQNAALIALRPEQQPIGVAHGWSPITEPMKVTKAEGNRVLSINWEPAFEVYRRIVEEHSGQRFADTDFFDLAKSYPLGILVMDAEMIIRDPYAAEGSELHIVDPVQEGEHISIMHGDMESLLQGARQARSAIDMQRSSFCIDCISRVLYMNGSFHRELEVLRGESGVHGILSIGEIANAGESYLEVYNKTVVLTSW